jgi:LysR family glycine cleavage system transcriptional activator
MTQDLPPLTALRAFHVAGRLLSFQEAAREMHVTPSAVSHQIRTLEDWLGVTLVHARRAAHRVDRRWQETAARNRPRLRAHHR